jgi:hypothetical protein
VFHFTCRFTVAWALNYFDNAENGLFLLTGTIPNDDYFDILVQYQALQI